MHLPGKVQSDFINITRQVRPTVHGLPRTPWINDIVHEKIIVVPRRLCQSNENVAAGVSTKWGTAKSAEGSTRHSFRPGQDSKPYHFRELSTWQDGRIVDLRPW